MLSKAGPLGTAALPPPVSTGGAPTRAGQVPRVCLNPGIARDTPGGHLNYTARRSGRCGYRPLAEASSRGTFSAVIDGMKTLLLSWRAGFRRVRGRRRWANGARAAATHHAAGSNGQADNAARGGSQGRKPPSPPRQPGPTRRGHAGADRAPCARTGHRTRRHGDHRHHTRRRHAAGDTGGRHRRDRALGGTRNDSGQLNFPGMQVGNYRLRFSGESVITLERDVTVVRGQVLQVDVALNAAPKPPPPPPAPAPAPVVAAAPEARDRSNRASRSRSRCVDLIEKEFVGRNPRRESLLSCSGTTRTTMLQINDPLPERMYAEADVVYYVLGGEGTMRLNGKESKITTNGFMSVPRGASHSFTRRGNRPLVLLSVLGGEACEAAK